MTALRDQPLVSWDEPATVGPRGTLVVVPGRGENPALYERFGRRLAFDAYRVRAVADPTRDPDGVRAQIEQLLADDTGPAPRVLVGSDTGALFALGLVATEAVSVDALVLAGLPAAAQSLPAEPSPTDATQQSVSGDDWERELAARTACPTHQARLSGDGDLRRGAIDQPPPAEWFAAADLARITVPVLGLHGTDDTVSPAAAARRRYAAAANATLVQIAGGRHDALNDATHRTAAATVVLFLERLRLGADLPVIAETVR